MADNAAYSSIVRDTLRQMGINEEQLAEAERELRARLAELGITQSMNRPGKLNDNAYIESFFHSMKSEIYHGLHFACDQELRTALRAYMPFYNRQRLHSSLNYVSPATYEQLLA